MTREGTTMRKLKKPNWNVESRVYGDNETPQTCSNCEYGPDFSCKTHCCIIPREKSCSKGYMVKLALLHKTVECLAYEEKGRNKHE